MVSLEGATSKSCSSFSPSRPNSRNATLQCVQFYISALPIRHSIHPLLPHGGPSIIISGKESSYTHLSAASNSSSVFSNMTNLIYYGIERITSRIAAVMLTNLSSLRLRQMRETYSRSVLVLRVNFESGPTVVLAPSVVRRSN